MSFSGAVELNAAANERFIEFRARRRSENASQQNAMELRLLGKGLDSLTISLRFAKAL